MTSPLPHNPRHPAPKRTAADSTREYVFEDKKLQRFFVRIVTTLSQHGLYDNIIESILTDVCRHFNFGCGLVYEADHSGQLLLKDKYLVYPDVDMPLVLPAGVISDPETLKTHDAGHVHIIFPGGDHSFDSARIKDTFQASLILLVPVIDEDNQMKGLVVMADRRSAILMDAESFNAAKTILNLISNHVKLRIAQRTVEYSKDFLSNFMNNIGIDIYVNDIETHEILYLNDSMAAPYGGVEKMLGRTCWQALYDDKTEECNFCPRRLLVDKSGEISREPYSWDYQRPFDGAWFRVVTRAFPWIDGRMAMIVSSVDITANKRNEELIRRMADSDPLTLLPNRRKLFDDCEAILPYSREAWAIFFDLDGFKDINDSLGHRAGDELLEAVARHMESSLITKSHCYRLGGDEFVLFYRDATRAKIDKIVRGVLDRFMEPWELSAKNGGLICRASLGVARYPDCGRTAQALMHTADMMMYKAKELGKGLAVFYDGEEIKAD